MVDLSLVTGWLPAVLTGIGFLVLLGLVLLPPRPSWWKRAVLLTTGTGLLVIGLNLFVTKVWKPFPDTLPTSVLVWAWLGLSGLAVAIALIVPRWRRWWTIVSALAGIIALLGIAGVQINRFYGQYPTLGAASGLTRPKLTELESLGAAADVVAAPEGGFLSEIWQPTGPLSEKGVVVQVRIPADGSGFRARPSYVYLPPAYLATTPRPLLPVLVLLAGQPGNADSWLISGQLTRMMDRYALAHKGLSPIVVMVDNLGANFTNPLCIDSKHGKVETYLTQDVPGWIRGNLQTAADWDMWAIAGLSSGGTCALQMAVRAPQLYGRFIDISGEYEPLDESKQQTVKKFFDGDEAAYAAISPVEIMKQRKFPDTAGRIVVGKGDRTYYPQLKQVLAACEAAGMTMTWLELPGGHTWQVWAPGLEQSLDWLAAQTRLVRA